jgi:2'-hydroxyisoflavone reductase
MIRLLEDKAAGIYNGSGPLSPMTTAAFVHGIHASYTFAVNFIQIYNAKFLQENELIGIQPWVIQLPKYAGMSKSDNRKAITTGLQIRSLYLYQKRSEPLKSGGTLTQSLKNDETISKTMIAPL